LFTVVKKAENPDNPLDKLYFTAVPSDENNGSAYKVTAGETVYFAASVYDAIDGANLSRLSYKTSMGASPPTDISVSERDFLDRSTDTNYTQLRDTLQSLYGQLRQGAALYLIPYTAPKVTATETVTVRIISYDQRNNPSLRFDGTDSDNEKILTSTISLNVTAATEGGAE
jgi:hypothetical protein